MGVLVFLRPSLLSSGNSACSIVGHNELSLRSANADMMRFDFNGQGTAGSWDGAENFELLVANGGNYSGHFYSAQPDDSGWGMTTLSFIDAQNALQLMAPIYYYDGAGQATWAIAAQGFVNNSSMAISPADSARLARAHSPPSPKPLSA